MRNREVKFWLWLVGLFPRKVLYFAVQTVWARATTGPYRDKQPDEVTWSMALKSLNVKGG